MCDRATLNLIKKEIADSCHDVFGDSLVSVLLYGSYARGDYDEYSDVDIAAIVKGERLDLQEKLKDVRKVANELCFNYDVVVSPVVIPEDEYTKYLSSSGCYKNIAKEGICIG